MNEQPAPAHVEVLPTDAMTKNLESMVTTSYAIQIIGCFIPFLHFVSLIIALINKPKAEGTWMESHFKYQIGTFIRAFVLGLIGVFLLLVIIGLPILLAAWVWTIIRCIHGYNRANAKQPV